MNWRIGLFDRDGTLSKDPTDLFSHLLAVGVYPVITTGRPLDLVLKGFPDSLASMLIEDGPFDRVPVIALNGASVGWINKSGEYEYQLQSKFSTREISLIGRYRDLGKYVEVAILNGTQGLEISCFNPDYLLVMRQHFGRGVQDTNFEAFTERLSKEIGSIILVARPESVAAITNYLRRCLLPFELGSFPAGRVSIDILPTGVNKATTGMLLAQEVGYDIAVLAGDGIKTSVAGIEYHGNDKCLLQLSDVPVRVLVGGSKSNLATHHTDAPENLYKVISEINL